MKTSVHILIVILVVFSFSNASYAGSDTLNIAFIAYQNPEQVMEDVAPVVAYLYKETGMKIRFNVATNYTGIVEALRNKTADVGFMGPLQYVMAHHYAGATPLLGEVYQGKPEYVSKIFVRKDSGIKTLQDLKGKSIAFTDPISSSGYLYPLELFRTSGLIKQDAQEFFKRTYFAGGDEQAIRAVHNGFVDAAGIGQFAYNLLRPEEKSDIISIADSAPLPSHCVVVREGYPAANAKRLKEALLALNDGPNKGLLKNLYGVDGYVPVTHDTYKGVEAVARTHGLLR
jgi:phosphonate transport system substrate-binding protein